jgi:hypothetical protein
VGLASLWRRRLASGFVTSIDGDRKTAGETPAPRKPVVDLISPMEREYYFLVWDNSCGAGGKGKNPDWRTGLVQRKISPMISQQLKYGWKDRW